MPDDLVTLNVEVIVDKGGQVAAVVPKTALLAAIRCLIRAYPGELRAACRGTCRQDISTVAASGERAARSCHPGPDRAARHLHARP